MFKCSLCVLVRFNPQVSRLYLLILHGTIALTYMLQRIGDML